MFQEVPNEWILFISTLVVHGITIAEVPFNSTFTCLAKTFRPSLSLLVIFGGSNVVIRFMVFSKQVRTFAGLPKL